MNMDNGLIEYSKEQFLNDVEEWINKQVKFLLTENWAKESNFTIVLDSYNCHVSEGHFSIWQSRFSLELSNEDYKIFIDKEYDPILYSFPVYYIFVKDPNGDIVLNGSNITIEVL